MSQIAKLDDEVKMVRGIWYCDGVPYRGWVPAYQDGNQWFGHDDAEIISSVDAVLEMSQLDELVDKDNR